MYSLRPLLLVPNMEVVYQLAVQIFFTESESASVTSQRPLIVFCYKKYVYVHRITMKIEVLMLRKHSTL
jgi:hypothetical protein